jgi:Asp-tRNA(Asn)/Glu-tRNA(Gln) amidotransferase A subunit family amidase
MPDLANSDTNRSSSFGRTGNAYDVRFSPGGSSGGTVTAVAANMVVLGNGTDTGNSIRMPAATSALVGVYPTRGLVSIAGVVPLDWLLDNTGPIARTVEDAAIALPVMAGTDPLDQATSGVPQTAQPPYDSHLQAGAPSRVDGSAFRPSFSPATACRSIFRNIGRVRIDQKRLASIRTPSGCTTRRGGRCWRST